MRSPSPSTTPTRRSCAIAAPREWTSLPTPASRTTSSTPPSPEPALGQLIGKRQPQRAQQVGDRPLLADTDHAAAHDVSLLRQPDELDHSASVSESLDQPLGVAQVHVLIRCAVDQQEVALDLGDVRECRRLVVAIRVLPWMAKVALRVSRVVTGPLAHG